MLSDEIKQTIDSLTIEELLQETFKGSNSRFQGEKYDYLLTRFALLNRQKEDAYKQRGLELGREANEIAKSANETSSKAYRMSVFSVVVAIIALLFVVLQYFFHQP